MRDDSSPRVSVLLPAYNAGETLPPCLRSIQRQSEPRWECVLVDDGSTDGTVDCARAFAEHDPRIRLFEQAHRGVVPALNAGLALCTARYVARMDADDVMHRRRLEEQTALLDGDHALSAVGCHVRFFPRPAPGTGYDAYERWLNRIGSSASVLREAFVECPVAHPTLVIRREVLLCLRYRDRRWPEDYDLVLRLLESGRRVGVLPRRRLGWRLREDSHSRTADAYRIERFAACKADFLARGFLAPTELYVLWGYGGTGRRLKRELANGGKRPSHIVELHPGRLGNRIHGAPVVPPEDVPALHGRPLIVSVAGEIARHQVREALAAMGFVETRDFVCAA